MSNKPLNLLGQGTEAVALRLCREVYRVSDGRTLWREAIDPIERDLGIDDAVAQSTLRFAASKRWIATVSEFDARRSVVPAAVTRARWSAGNTTCRS
jgi:hypothetical protein